MTNMQLERIKLKILFRDEIVFGNENKCDDRVERKYFLTNCFFLNNFKLFFDKNNVEYLVFFGEIDDTFDTDVL